ncbi:putative bifunctional diguanylate cyclase/phosphodiesterase [Pseudomonas japonica]|uniref:putative bifunctional diguanylate cyclase/phosphodiesterase n=1 Tax=Pseudomonas japonica TaxID=256466 RepID=UPI0015E3895B|nr:EAL domain-containing protein [Pseudomonas japonica]MBA1242788.1 EAL domain-containing protein [Pseudomonas japonica]MBA1291612.1 EAL domain-containing protein [Pseudomonas japonica]
MASFVLRRFLGLHQAWLDSLFIALLGTGVLTLCIELDFYEVLTQFNARHERWQADEVFLAFVVVGWCGLIFGIRRIAELRREIRSRRLAEQAALEMATHDPLTRLPNRRGLDLNFHSRRLNPNEPFFLVVFDLDGFKSVNDVYGHSAGDRLLQELACRIRTVLPEGDFACRLGGDEFALIIRSAKTPESASCLLAQLTPLLSSPVTFDSVRLVAASTYGVAEYPKDGESLSSLLRRADLALYQGKHDGKGTICFFDARRDCRLEEQSQATQLLREALDNGYLSLAYQPIVTVKGERVVGFEALARLTHPLHGDIPPSIFIPAAERSGLMRDVTNLLLERACREAHGWPVHLSLAFNLSALDLRDEWLVQRVQTALQRSGLAPNRLELEVTETAVVGNIALARKHLEALRGMGIRIAMDDFGTGYSSLAQLGNLNFDKLKIDRSFINTVLENDKNGRIVRAIIHLSEGLALPAVAEGVESQGQAQWLIEAGCPLAQGYLFSKPLTEAKLRELLSAPLSDHG